MKDFIYLDIYAQTASFKVPQIYQGFLLSLPLPPYSTILGMLSRILGRELKPTETRIGYKYQIEGKGNDFETYHRWERKVKTGSYTYQKTAVRSREVHFGAHLQIILDNCSLMKELRNPKQIITLGRSQDVATILELKLINGEPVDEGILNNTLVGLSVLGDDLVNGMFYNLPEYFDYVEGQVRLPKNITQYLAISTNQEKIKISDLYLIEDEIFYLYSWRN